MMRLVVLLSLCGMITGINDTLNNVILNNKRLDLGRQNEEFRPVENRTLNEVFADAVHAYLEEDWDRCVEDFNTVTYR